MTVADRTERRTAKLTAKRTTMRTGTGAKVHVKDPGTEIAMGRRRAKRGRAHGQLAEAINHEATARLLREMFVMVVKGSVGTKAETGVTVSL